MPSGPLMLTNEAGLVMNPRKSSMICAVGVSLKYAKEGSPRLAAVAVPVPVAVVGPWAEAGPCAACAAGPRLTAGSNVCSSCRVQCEETANADGAVP